MFFVSNAESYCLILWPEEKSVSVVPEFVVLGDVVLGKECQINIGRKKYTGQILALGMYV